MLSLQLEQLETERNEQPKPHPETESAREQGLTPARNDNTLAHSEVLSNFDRDFGQWFDAS